MLRDIYISNAVNACDCTARVTTISMRTTDLEDVSGYPVEVFNVDLISIGMAIDKDEYISVWNADPFNTAVGMLSGNDGPFRFKITRNAGPLPAYVYGNPLGFMPNLNNIIQEDGQDIIQEDGQEIIIE